jgi:putative two-component system response regulator
VRALARKLKSHPKFRAVLDDETIEVLYKSAPLHDIGKVGIPDSILLKPGRLSPEEWEIMKTHAELGALTLDGVIREHGGGGFLSMGRDIAWAHHERFDGSGYPRGLAGETIPLAARILAVADVYDALVSDRVYRPAWEPQRALALLQEGAGVEFDERCVAALERRLEQKTPQIAGLYQSALDLRWATS